MIYVYQCPQCNFSFEVVKHHTEYDTIEKCEKCSNTARMQLQPAGFSGLEQSEFNHGLGCVVNNKKHRAELAKRKGLIEVGNESPEVIHKEADDTLKDNLSWKGVD